MTDIWHQVFGQSSDTVSWYQMSARAVFVGLYTIVLYRLMPKRAFGHQTVFDLALTVIVGSALGRAMTGNSPLLPVLAGVACLALLYSALAWLLPRSPPLSRLVTGCSVELVRDGKVEHKTLRQHFLGIRDLEEAMRQHGVTDLDQVDRVHLERDGTISIIVRNSP